MSPFSISSLCPFLSSSSSDARSSATSSNLPAEFRSPPARSMRSLSSKLRSLQLWFLRARIWLSSRSQRNRRLLSPLQFHFSQTPHVPFLCLLPLPVSLFLLLLLRRPILCHQLQSSRRVPFSAGEIDEICELKAPFSTTQVHQHENMVVFAILTKTTASLSSATTARCGDMSL